MTDETKECPYRCVRITSGGCEGWSNIIHTKTGFPIAMVEDEEFTDDFEKLIKAWNTRPREQELESELSQYKKWLLAEQGIKLGLDFENTALKTELAKHEWQDISTAPIDEEILVARKDKGYWWGLFDGKHWVVRYGDHYDDVDDITHWQPLPTPPKEK